MSRTSGEFGGFGYMDHICQLSTFWPIEIFLFWVLNCSFGPRHVYLRDVLVFAGTGI